MRKCLRCDEEMVEGLNLVADSISGGLKITEKNLHSGNTVVKPKVCLCAKCGYMELFTDNLNMVRQFI